MKRYTKQQRDAQLSPHNIGDGNWFYVSGGECSFHNDKHGGEGVKVSWRTLQAALRKAGLIPKAQP